MMCSGFNARQRKDRCNICGKATALEQQQQQ